MADWISGDSSIPASSCLLFHSMVLCHTDISPSAKLMGIISGLHRQSALPALIGLRLSSATLACRYSADKAGQYELAVKSSQNGEPLAGSPFGLTVSPAELSPSHCTAELAHDGTCLTAGAEAAVCVHAKDHYGNTVSTLWH